MAVDIKLLQCISKLLYLFSKIKVKCKKISQPILHQFHSNSYIGGAVGIDTFQPIKGNYMA